MERNLIAIVEDDESLRESLALMLKATANVISFASAIEFLDYLFLKGAPPDLLITDFSMPKMSGIEMIARADEKGFRFPSILISGYLNKSLAIEAVNRGICVILEKPIDTEHFLSIVDRLLLNQNISNVKTQMMKILGQMQELVSAFRDICINELELKAVDDPEALLDSAGGNMSLNAALSDLEIQLRDLRKDEQRLSMRTRARSA